MLCRVIASLFFTNPAFADEWQKLDGEGVKFALSARVLQYENAMQNFFKDGRTLYESPGVSWGRWQVVDDRYCSNWPPSGAWVCYDLERHERGQELRFTGPSGDITVGRYIDLN